MSDQIHWDIRNDGRPWLSYELTTRRAHMPEKFEVIDGRVLWDERELLTVLGMVLEQAGADKAVELGEFTVWRRAFRRRRRGERRALWRRVFLEPVDAWLVLLILGQLMVVGGVMLVPRTLGHAIVAHPVPLLLMLAGLMLVFYSAVMDMTKRQ